jgi:hypothetical protein
MTSTAAIARLTAQIEAVEDQLAALRHRRPGTAGPPPEGVVHYLRTKHGELADRLAEEMRAAEPGPVGTFVRRAGTRLFRATRGGRSTVRRLVERAWLHRAEPARRYGVDDRA